MVGRVQEIHLQQSFLGGGDLRRSSSGQISAQSGRSSRRVTWPFVCSSIAAQTAGRGCGLPRAQLEICVLCTPSAAASAVAFPRAARMYSVKVISRQFR